MIVVSGHIRADLAKRFLYGMEIVEKPFYCIRMGEVFFRGGGKKLIRALQQLSL
jgi:hypothetical protein